MSRLPVSVSRHAIALITGLCGLAMLVPAAAQTAAWPTRPVRLRVAFPAGGLADVMTRSVQQQFGEALGQPLVIENRGGAGGNVAGTEVARNGGDGHTFLITTSTTELVNPSMFARMPFDPQKDLQPWPCSPTASSS
ncbi:tripartite-type tricarboxylate transporter receptor subunit TctC [Variovorax paradoxus]|uniref:Tripartite-type tricarboxylate transporter receptor subunit TctC n=1 Tax=Variovorax paradoxus TaxID=34073 RepID=A0AAE3Y3N1_VARPD|nr:tripartite tricarboxylate transporter substrate-binding protein [Variovorax paradoxus]MDP9965510.1 tripartite-type tricarboxylate transporter receptor subunit TctC [Variovorax paradoxus]MDR6428768.1 tripartite-type tricarboxylate transporter receptor subunit TctC [Variovorax paradoxus]MDR6455906.1 tripartite-type tricarboxylate transporter receptor subunit TctC [Variovorax paradoxus]